MKRIRSAVVKTRSDEALEGGLTQRDDGGGRASMVGAKTGVEKDRTRELRQPNRVLELLKDGGLKNAGVSMK